MHLWNVCASTSRGHPTRLSWGILSESCLPILFPLSEQLSAQFAASLRWLAAMIGGSPQKTQRLKISPNLKRKKTLGINSRHVFFVIKLCLLKTWGDKKKLPSTVDGSEIPKNHLGCLKLCKSWDQLPVPQLVNAGFRTHQGYVANLFFPSTVQHDKHDKTQLTGERRISA